MHLQWKVLKNRLVLESEDGTLLEPSAEDIFFLQFSEKSLFSGIEVEKPSHALNDIEFSKYPVSFKVIIENSTRVQESYIICRIIIVKNNKELEEVTLTSMQTDHVIIKNIWFPIVKGALEEVKEVFQKAGIIESGSISIKQYVMLRNSGKEFLQDKLSELPFSKPGLISSDESEIKCFKGKLYPYQNQGYRWLKMIVNEDAGCILADEMGLGKTAQVIAVLSSQKNSSSPSLVVAPVSLLENWRREVLKFSPHLTTMIHQGQNRTGFYKEFSKYNLIITSYETVLRDLSIFQMVNWNIVIADEAQAIKNPAAKRTMAVKDIKRNASIAVTGTPMENRLDDIWSIADFAFPGFLGSLKEFQTSFPNGTEAAEELEPIISPILLRRRVNEVAKDLPSRIDIPQVLKLNSVEAQKYEEYRNEILKQYGKQASLVSLIKLRMFCAHPFLQNEIPDTGDPAEFSKYSRLIEIIEEIILNKEKVIVFTSFQKMIEIMKQDLSKRFNIYCNFIDGRVAVEERQTIIDEFSNVENSAILLLNPKAAGAGLNITSANHVIHYTLEWNPAIEDQASARAYRRGQNRPVSVHRLYCADTVEEVINEKIEEKRNISKVAIIGTDGLKSDEASILKALLRSPISKGEKDNGKEGFS